MTSPPIALQNEAKNLLCNNSNQGFILFTGNYSNVSITNSGSRFGIPYSEDDNFVNPIFWTYQYYLLETIETFTIETLDPPLSFETTIGNYSYTETTKVKYTGFERLYYLDSLPIGQIGYRNRYTYIFEQYIKDFDVPFPSTDIKSKTIVNSGTEFVWISCRCQNGEEVACRADPRGYCCIPNSLIEDSCRKLNT